MAGRGKVVASLGVAMECAKPDLGGPPAALPLPRIRAGRRTDLSALVELENEVFATDRLSRRSYANLLKSGSVIVATINRVLAGSAVVLVRGRKAHIHSIAAAPEYQGCGIAALLLHAMEYRAQRRGCRVIGVEARHDNIAAIKFYSKWGFRQSGYHYSYYEDGADAVVFERSL